MNRIVHYAKLGDYTRYTSTLPEAWRMSIRGLTDSIALGLDHFRLKLPELTVDTSFDDDPISRFGISEAQKHRHRGITLGHFLGLMKYYAQTYTDLIRELYDSQPEHRDWFCLFVTRCFDRVEIAFVTEWNSHEAKGLLDELQAENKALTNMKNKYLTLFESISSPLVFVNDDLRVVSFNQAAATLFEALREDKKIYELGYTGLSRSIRDYMDDENDQRQHVFSIEQENMSFHYSLRFSRMKDLSGKFSGMVIEFNDITRLVNAERQFKQNIEKANNANRLKYTFLKNMSHEVRTPMNAIVGFTNILCNANLDQEKRLRYTEYVEENCQQLLGIIDNILDMSKIQTQQLNIESSIFSINDMMKETFANFRDKARTLGLAFDMRVGLDGEDNFVWGDPIRIRQVLHNLLSNALKYTDKGNVQFGYERQGDDLVFYVKDTGCGISKGKQNAIFSFFEQKSDENHSQKTYGPGLGLSISRSLVEMMGGNIWLDSDSGQGATFWVRLPYKPVREIPKVGDSKPKNTQNPKTMTVLLVEDERINMAYLEELMLDMGHDYLKAYNGRQAVDLALKHDVDLVLMDIKMPEMDGLEATAIIKNQKPWLPVVAQTAYVLPEDEKSIHSAGCDQYVSKPINRKKFQTLIESYQSRVAQNA